MFGILVITMSDSHARDHGFDSRLYSGNFSECIGSGMEFTKPCEDNWVAASMKSSEIRLRKQKLRLRHGRLAR